LKLNKNEDDDNQSFEKHEKEEKSVTDYDDQNPGDNSMIEPETAHQSPKLKAKVVNFKDDVDNDELADNHDDYETNASNDQHEEPYSHNENGKNDSNPMYTEEQNTTQEETIGANVSLNDEKQMNYEESPNNTLNETKSHKVEPDKSVSIKEKLSNRK
jgi:hypothetical protein